MGMIDYIVSTRIRGKEGFPLDIRLFFAYHVIVKIDCPALSKPVA